MIRNVEGNGIIMEKDKTVINEIECNTPVNYGGFKFKLTEKDIKSLEDGGIVALNIDDEYVVFLSR